VGYVASVIDITDVRRAQEEALSRQKLESLGVLSAGVAHDFNNLLGSIIAEADLAEQALAAGELARELKVDSSAGEHVERIKAISFRASGIVRQLMIYSGQERGDIEALDVSEVVAEMLDLLKASISKRALLKADLNKNLPMVLGNVPQIRQVVMNLVLNASEAVGEKGGAVHVTTSLVNQPISLGGSATLPTGECLQLEVTDTGCGMSEEVQAKVFDPFYTTKSPGRGLGMAVVHTIVRNHGGAVKLTSALGRGTTVQVVLPWCTYQAAKQDGAITVPALQHHANGKKRTMPTKTARAGF